MHCTISVALEIHASHRHRAMRVATADFDDGMEKQCNNTADVAATAANAAFAADAATAAVIATTAAAAAIAAAVAIAAAAAVLS